MLGAALDTDINAGQWVLAKVIWQERFEIRYLRLLRERTLLWSKDDELTGVTTPSFSLLSF